MLRLIGYVAMALIGGAVGVAYTNSDKIAKGVTRAVAAKVANGVDQMFDSMAKESEPKSTEPVPRTEPAVTQKPTKEVIDEELVKPADRPKEGKLKEDVIETTFIRK